MYPWQEAIAQALRAATPEVQAEHAALVDRYRTLRAERKRYMAEHRELAMIPFRLTSVEATALRKLSAFERDVLNVPVTKLF